jgi:sulfite reductase (NADPH) flavoprotein alpha-component
MKNFWIKTHWLLGITAGVVLCVVGVTGAMQSFEEDILEWLNPEVFSTESATTSETPLHELFGRAQSAKPDQRITSWQIFAAPGHRMRIGFEAAAAPAPGEKKRTEFYYLNSADGQLYPPLRGDKFFHTVNDIHRRLAGGDIGKHIVGASVLALVVLSLSGLYLRWPNKPLQWRPWFKLNFNLKGRRFLRDLHMITGTWVLLLYLLSALTGLYWSYEWYKNGLHTLTGTARPLPVKLEKPVANLGNAGSYIEQWWTVFLQEGGSHFQHATLKFPEKPDQPLEIRYLSIDSPHDRAYNRLLLHPLNGDIMNHERYAEKTAGEKLIASIYVLHTGTFFGLAGIILLMISSLLMPLFAVTGWQMYLDRRRRERAAAASVARLAATVQPRNDSIG